jgi:hypothetical protein
MMSPSTTLGSLLMKAPVLYSMCCGGLDTSSFVHKTTRTERRQAIATTNKNDRRILVNGREGLLENGHANEYPE